MPAAIPIAIAALAVTAAGTGYEMVQANQAKQHAEGAARAERDAMNNQINQAKTEDTQNKDNQANTAKASNQAAINAIRASLSANTGFGGSIMSSPTGAAPAPTQAKTLLGA